MFAGVRIVAPLVKAAMSLKHLIPASVALVLAACSPSNGSEKGGKGHGGGSHPCKGGSSGSRGKHSRGSHSRGSRGKHSKKSKGRGSRCW